MASSSNVDSVGVAGSAVDGTVTGTVTSEVPVYGFPEVSTDFATLQKSNDTIYPL